MNADKYIVISKLLQMREKQDMCLIWLYVIVKK